MASVGQKIIAFVYFALIARHIGAEGTGTYFFALAYTTVFVVFVDMGFTNVMVREAARVKDKLQLYFSTVLSVKILFGILSYIAAVVIINLMGYGSEVKNLVYLSGVTMLFDSFHLSIYGTLRAIGDLRWESISLTGSQFLTLILGTIFLYAGLPIIFLILAFTISSLVNVCFAMFIAVYKYKLKLVPKFDRAIFFHFAKIAIPFALAAIFARVYSYIDSILLSRFLGNESVGWYSIAHKVTFAFQFIPLALVAAIYPRFSEYFVHDKKKLAYIFERSVKYLLLIAFPIAVGISLLSQDLILLLFTEEYLKSILPLQILITSLVFSFVSFPIGAFLNASNRQVTQTTIVGTVMVVNIIMNLLLIPHFGIIGAAISALVGNVLLALLGYLFVPKITKISHLFLFKALLQIMVASVTMGILVYITNQYAHFIFAILTGVLVYPIMLFVTGAVNKKQLVEALSLIKK